MRSINGYEIIDTIYEGKNSIIMRGIAQSNKKPVVIKTLRNEYPNQEELARFRREYEINLKAREVSQIFSLENSNDTLFMTWEDVGADSLEHLLSKSKLSTEEFLVLALKICDNIRIIHQLGIIHKDINPTNIILDKKKNKIQIIDFGIATELMIENLSVIEGTLSYLSPEQTGRTNRSIDNRTDLYSLGITFYKMITGSLPFQTNDAIEMVYCHIAKTPKPPHKMNKLIPLPISEIIMKLISKMPEDRYQSINGLEEDLKECLARYKNHSLGNDFVIGLKDVSSEFRISQELYGREKEITLLMNSFDRINQGSIEVMLVSGYSGIGKSALIGEIQNPISKMNGYFITGKFDQLQRNIPYFSVIQAFQCLVRQILSESQERINLWKEKLLSSIGHNGQVLIQVIPEIELIVGEQSPVPVLSAAESMNRFKIVFQNFIRVFASKDHPLVIFLDDLQWADLPTLKLIEAFLTDMKMNYFYLIGAYRDSEINETHPLHILLKELKEAKVRVEQIYLEELKGENVNHLIADTLKIKPEKTKILAELCIAKTKGNPFYLKEFLRSLHQEKMINFNFKSGSWEWDLNSIKNADTTENVVDFITKKIMKLSLQAQDILKYASCIGNQFSLKTLAVINGKTSVDTSLELWEVLQEGFILPIENTYRLAGHWNDVNTTYKFLHDRIQQAAYSLIEEKNRQSIHYKIGRLMLKSVPYRELEEKIFDIVYQLNQGKDCITDKNEIAELINLNIKAGKKAKTSAAFLPAYNHFMFAISLLKEDRWNNHYDICLDLYNHASETAYLSDDFETMKILSEEILSNSKNILDKVTIYEVLIKADISRNLLTTAIKTGLEILAQLGLKMPEKPSALLLLYSIIKVNLVLSRRKIEHLIDLPEMTDPIQLVIIRIASITGTAAYYVNPVLLALMTLNCLSISLRYGLTSLSAFVYAGFGLILCGILGNSEMGYQIGSICLKILERFNAKDQKAKTMVVFYLFINHWKNPLKSSFKPLLEAYQIGVDVGDFEYAAGALANYLSSVVYSDINLQEMENELCVYGDTIAKLNQGTHLFASIMVRQAVLNLLYESDLPWELTGKTFNREVNLAQFLESDNKTALALYYLHEIELKKLYNKFKAVYWPQLIKQFLSIIFPDSHGNKSGIDIPIVL